MTDSVWFANNLPMARAGWMNESSPTFTKPLLSVQHCAWQRGLKDDGMWFRLFEHFANHEGNIFVLWCGDKVMAGSMRAEMRKGHIGGREEGERNEKESPGGNKSFKDRLNLEKWEKLQQQE